MRGRLAVRTLLHLPGLKGLLTLNVRQHELTQLHHLLYRLFAQLQSDLGGFQTPVRTLRHRAQLGQHAFLASHLPSLQIGRFQRSQSGVQRRLRPLLILLIPLLRPVAETLETVREFRVEVRHRIRQCPALAHYAMQRPNLRHDWAEYEATVLRDSRETLAHSKGLQYIGLEGTVGIIANGAGLAMSTLDVVNQVGGSAANFLDIGGGANADVMAGALEVINTDPMVKSIFINIFGGITRGEEVAKGIVEAMGRVKLNAPIVIRLDGTNAEEGRAILAAAGIPADRLISKPTMLEAARAAVELAR